MAPAALWSDTHGGEEGGRHPSTWSRRGTASLPRSRMSVTHSSRRSTCRRSYSRSRRRLRISAACAAFVLAFRPRLLLLPICHDFLLVAGLWLAGGSWCTHPGQHPGQSVNGSGG